MHTYMVKQMGFTEVKYPDVAFFFLIWRFLPCSFRVLDLQLHVMWPFRHLSIVQVLERTP